ncbi:hypothetical protein CFC21_008585 [Triticum aestivum]|uniref:KIB1-4 beta-propeller domain-containing protein n=3 Tax=Triticum TaxID=4564 RepID=A0A9R0VAZ0_TRITD|nr:hypothetical protein CFC21_008585 [Triticum aestivum]VAH22110.1 unnamed protein product [Triticum turgidum subsp. durum]
MATSTPASWSELPPDVLGLVINRLVSLPRRASLWSRLRRHLGFRARFREWPRVRRFLDFIAGFGFKKVRRDRHWVSFDRARFRMVCRSWHRAMRRHIAASRQVPWIVMSDGSFFTPSDPVGTSPSRLPTLPSNTTCIASCDDWLALDLIDDDKMHSYSLHNPFTGTTVLLPELDAIIGNVSKIFKVRKVLLRSTPSDIIAVMTNNWNHPLILVRPGKGVWLPEPQSVPFIYIVDIAFLGDKLYGITRAEDLVSLDINFDSDGIPTVTSIERLIKHPSGNYDFDVWRDVDDNKNDEGGKDEATNNYEGHTEAPREQNPEEAALEELRKKTGDDMILEGVVCWVDDDVPYEPKDLITVMWHLVESCGKLLMVRRQLHWPAYSINFTSKVEVYETGVNEGAQWVLVSGGLGNQTLFISKFFCKSIYTCEDGDREDLHFIDTGEKYNLKSQTMSPTWRDFSYQESMWIFSEELVV